MSLDAGHMSVVHHLAELRSRLLVVIAGFIVGAVAGWYGQAWLLRLFLENVGTLVFFTPAEMFLTKIRIAATIGAVITVPIVLSQAWLFVMPGLYPAERHLLRRAVWWASGLFVLGLAVGYYAAYPLMLRFLLHVTDPALMPVVSVADHLTLFTGIVLPFGVLFQIPLVLPLLTRLGVIHPLLLQRPRRHAVFWSVVIAAFITPPDVVTQLVMAVPLYVLFEIAIMRARHISSREER